MSDLILTSPASTRRPSVPVDYLALAHKQSDRFWGKVDKTGGCWLWQAGTCKDGYGKFAITTGTRPKQVHVRAHRLAWELLNGPAPSGLVVMHRCDTPACVNPAHLRLGTQAENRADCCKKSRASRGEQHGRAALTEKLVREIRERHRTGDPQARIAKALGVGRASVYQIVAGKTWRHLA